jgi:hypothetical protein
MWSDNISSGKVGRNKLRTQTQKKFLPALGGDWEGWEVHNNSALAVLQQNNHKWRMIYLGRNQGNYFAIVVLATPQEEEKGTWTTAPQCCITNEIIIPIFSNCYLCEIQINQHSTRWNPKWLLNIWNKNYCNLHEINCCTLLTSNPHTHNYTYTLTFYHIYNVFHACQIVCIST